MQFLYQLRELLAKKSSRFLALKSYLDKTKKNGEFYRFTTSKRINLISKTTRLQKRVNSLHWKLKLAALGGTVAALTPFDKAQAQDLGPFVKKDRLENPLRTPLPGRRLKPAVVDLDNDGDFDIVVRENYSYLRLFNNNGDGTFELGQRLYATYTGPYGPYQLGISSGNPSFVDADEDGDLDLVLGEPYGDNTLFYKNNGDGSGSTLPTFTLQTGPWDPVLKTGNPFDSFSYVRRPRYFFIDLDGNGDMDVLISGTGNASDDPQILYFENIGSFQFQPATIPGLLPTYSGDYGDSASALLADIDQDGELDLLYGRANGDLTFFKGIGGTLTKQTGPWDPVAKTGNPFEDVDLGNGVSYPALVDVDLDGDDDLIVGYYQPYLQNVEPLAYFENNGNGVFDRKIFLDNPFGGAATGSQGAPYFVDVDGDGQLDALLGGKYGNTLTYYKNDNGAFSLVLGPESPFDDIISGFSYWAGAKPVYIDIDDDGDLDLITGDYYGNITFFRNDNGTLSKQIMDATNPFFALGSPTNNDPYTGFNYSVHIYGNYNTAIDLVDIDNDGDLDLFSGNDDGTIDFFENVGTNTSPQFEIPSDPSENPLDQTHIPEFQSNFFDSRDTQPKFIDLDHDGDFDLLLGGRYDVSYKYNGNAIFYFENVGTPEAASFVMQTPALLSQSNYNPNPGLIDADGDGDLDIFVGDGDGHFTFYENVNPAVAAVVNPNEVTYIFGSGPIVVDATITLSDSDNDFITQAIVAIQGYQTGDVLTFTPQGNVNGVFDTNTGVLTLSGEDVLSVYQDVLRSVMYNYTGPQPSLAGKTGKTGRTVVVPKTLQFSVFDSDFTTPAIQTKVIALTVPNIGPSVTTSAGISTYVGTAVIVDGAIAVTDPDDADLAGAVVQINSSTFISVEDVLQFTNQNGISGTYTSATGTLTLTGVSSTANYQTALQSVQYVNSLSFPANATRVFDFYVDDGEALSSTVSKSLDLNVPANNAPTIATSALNTVINNSVSLDLTTIISDPDGNLDPLSFSVIPNVSSTPSRVGNASISGNILTVDYAGTDFAGADYVTIQACDLAGLCAAAEISIQVQGDIIVRNGMSPNGDGKNDYFQLVNITTLGSQNKVSIYNRWGDKVFEVENYDNQTRRFEGKSDGGNDLPSGVYFYKIEFVNGNPELKGYLTLKR